MQYKLNKSVVLHNWGILCGIESTYNLSKNLLTYDNDSIETSQQSS
ncbi:MAG: hypothetical protein Q8S21_05570 [Candidatus Paracaedibacteraceae bacterium]|nr:hypothetical protein [Candidatus Paracaedibacteraceae bacterium]